MKKSISLALLFVLSPFLSAVADTVPGFEDAAVYNDVMKGNIRVEVVKATDTQSTFIVRGFFNKTSPDLYVDLATDHKKYPVMFSPEIKDGKTKSVNADRTEWTYWLDIMIKVLFFSEHIYPEGKQVYTRPVDAISEGVLTHTVSNYTDTLKSMLQRTRLIPHQGGILVYDYVDYTLVKPSSYAETIRTKLKDLFLRMMTTYRKNLSGGRD